MKLSKSDLPRLTIKQVAVDHGVTTNAVDSWLRKNGLMRSPYCVKQGRLVMVRLDVAERYAERRSPGKPKDWVSRKVLAMDLELNVTGKLMVRLLRGARTLLYRNQLYIHPEDAETGRLRFQAMRPPPGWVPVSEVARELRRDRSLIHAWGKRNGVKMPLYRGACRLERHMYKYDVARYALVVGQQNAWRVKPMTYQEAA